MQYLVLSATYEERENPGMVVDHTVPVPYGTFPRNSNTDLYIPQFAQWPSLYSSICNVNFPL